MTHLYARPPIDAPDFHDAKGRVIPYGSRWTGMPPEDTYSVDTHPERFAPIHTVAEALISHLQHTYDVTVTDGPETADDLLYPHADVVRSVRIEPRHPASAPLTFVFTPYPGVSMHAGVLHDFHYPSCGCDACDSSWEAEADQLEQHVFAVVGGRYRETVDGWPRTWVGYAMTYPEGSTSGRGPAPHLSAARVKAARKTLRALPSGWVAWPLRSPAE